MLSNKLNTQHLPSLAAIVILSLLIGFGVIMYLDKAAIGLSENQKNSLPAETVDPVYVIDFK